MSVENWFEEKQSAWLYRIVTRAEPDPVKSTLFAELADMAESQARIWEKQIPSFTRVCARVWWHA